MNPVRILSFVIVASVWAGCSKVPDSPPAFPPKPKTAASLSTISPVTSAASEATSTASEHHDDAIAWRRGDVDAAFAEAKAANKPVFLYWGAAWCPPCNQVKAALFNKREFIARTQFFVPVYVDGDTPAAQQLGTRFKVSGYPTRVLFKPDGEEITRLPGEADTERYMQVLTLGMNAARPMRATLASALAGGKGLSADEWRMLAWYSWDSDAQQLVPTAKVPATLKALAAHCPVDQLEARTRLTLKMAAAVGDATPSTSAKRSSNPAPTIDRKAVLEEVRGVLSSPKAARENFDVLTNAMAEIVRATTDAGSSDRARLAAEADRALSQLARDTSLSNTDRLGATIARVQLATIDAQSGAVDGKAVSLAIPDSLSEEVRSEVARADRESRDPYERQTVINAAAYALTSAGLIADSDALLKAELTRSHSPYYFMLDLALNARKRGDKAAALDWYAKAYDAAKGPATRLQWGATYVTALIELAPDDAAGIERAAKQVIGEIEAIPSSFDGRNRKNLSRMSARLAAWSEAGTHAGQARRVADTAHALCARLPQRAPERTRCKELLGTDAKAVPLGASVKNHA